MADIHILKGTYNAAQSAIFKQYALHIPIAASVVITSVAEDPDVVNFVSKVPGLAASETALVKSGELVERIVTDKYHTWDSPPTVLARIRGIYADLISVVEEEYIRKYEYYLNTQSAS